jgi:exopolyphosphatase / guanosine-5'-triphosphate,3'-diphosphate pyrophosphatase
MTPPLTRTSFFEVDMTSASRSVSEVQRVTSLDIGSNSVLMLIAERDSSGEWVAREEHEAITRLSQGLDKSGVISAEALQRTAAALTGFLTIARGLNSEVIIATGTAPFRRALNGDAAAATLSSHLDGAPISIISGDQEAALNLLATRRAFPQLRRMMIIDIGGASTEVVLTEDGELSPHLASLNVGTVTLTERIISHHPIPTREQALVRAAVQQELSAHPFSRQLLGWDAPLIATAGTATTLAALSLELSMPALPQLHGLSMHRDELHRLCVALSNLTVTQRAHLPGIPTGRADIIATGALILDTLVSATSTNLVYVSTHGIRWGRLYEWLEQGQDAASAQQRPH